MLIVIGTWGMEKHGCEGEGFKLLSTESFCSFLFGDNFYCVQVIYGLLRIFLVSFLDLHQSTPKSKVHRWTDKVVVVETLLQ